ncbi:hypothetical protein B0H11DRAFT_2286526, partial [Mycena galericulata]
MKSSRREGARPSQRAVKAFDKLFTTAPDPVDVVKQLYLDIPEKPDPWNKLVKVRVMRTASTSARTADTGGLNHCVNCLLPDPSKTPWFHRSSRTKANRTVLTSAALNTSTPDTLPSARNILSPDTLTPTSPNTSSSDLLAAASNPPAPKTLSGTSNPPSPDADDELATRATDALRTEFFDRLGSSSPVRRPARTLAAPAHYAPPHDASEYTAETLKWNERIVFGDATDPSRPAEEAAPNASAEILTSRAARRATEHMDIRLRLSLTTILKLIALFFAQTHRICIAFNAPRTWLPFALASTHTHFCTTRSFSVVLRIN